MLLLDRAMEEMEAEKAAIEEELQLTGLPLDDLQVSHKKIIRGGQAWRARVWLLRLKVRQFVLQDLCKEIHAKIEMVDEERYDCEAKVT